MTTQQHIILLLSIIIGFLVLGLLILKKSLYNHNVKLQEELNDLRIETAKDFERVRFTEKPICDIGTKYGDKLIVIMAKRFERQNIMHPPTKSGILLGHEYNILNLVTKGTTYFGSNMSFSTFLKENNLSILNSNEDKN